MARSNGINNLEPLLHLAARIRHIAVRNRETNNLAFFVVRQWRPYRPESQSLVDHLFVEVRGLSDTTPLAQFESMLENSTTENGACWVIDIMGPEFLLTHWRPRTRQEGDTASEDLKFLNLSKDVFEIDLQLREIARTPM